MGAGFILYRKNPLTIFTLYKSNKKGKGMDLPKGSSEEGETPLETAIRECSEECGITPTIENIMYNFHVNKGKLTLFLCPYNEDWIPVIQPNPQTGKIEHTHYSWCTPLAFERGCVKHLKGVGYIVQALERDGII